VRLLSFLIDAQWVGRAASEMIPGIALFLVMHAPEAWVAVDHAISSFACAINADFCTRQR
jgi:hypothetical protein